MAVVYLRGRQRASVKSKHCLILFILQILEPWLSTCVPKAFCLRLC